MSYEPGQIYVPRPGEVRDDFLTDIRLELIDQGVDDPPVQENTDWYVLAVALEGAAQLQYANLRIYDDQSDELRATGKALDDKRKALGLPEVTATSSYGPIKIKMPPSATQSLAQGTQLVFPNGVRAEVAQNHIGLTNGAIVEIITIDTGDRTRLAAGATVRFVSPPANILTDAVVQAPGILGGTDAEMDDRKRTRILNRRRNVPAGGNWGHVRELALNANAAIQDVFVYPALGGPASQKVVAVKDYDVDQNDFTRIPTTAQLNQLRAALYSDSEGMPSNMDTVIQGPTEVDANFSILVTLPEAAVAGGTGRGWVDYPVWPQLVVADANKVTVTAVTSTQQITVSANTAVSPVAGQTHIAWWSPQDRRFRTYLVTAVSGTAGAWVLTLDSPLTDTTSTSVAAGDYVSPAALNLGEYGKAWRDILRQLGPYENTSDANRLPRAQRHPFLVDERPATPTALNLAAMAATYKEITNISFGATSTLAVPGSVDTGPQIFKLKHFGVYRL